MKAKIIRGALYAVFTGGKRQMDNLQERELDVDGRIILKCTLQKWGPR